VSHANTEQKSMANIVNRWTTRLVVCRKRSKSRYVLTNASANATVWIVTASVSGAMNDDDWNTPAWSIGAVIPAATLPACLRVCVPAFLRACVPTCLRPCLRACDPASLPACLPGCLAA
jgi:hypothetical protein